MAKDNDKTPGFRILEGYRAGMENLVSGQVENWTRFWDHIDQEDYTFASWTSDIARFWGSWANGVVNLATAPMRQVNGDSVPVLVFVLDQPGAAMPSKEIAVPPTFRFDSSVRRTEWSGDLPAEFKKKLDTTFQLKESEGRLRVLLNPISELKKSKTVWPSGTEVRALIYQARTPIAGIQVVFA